MSNPIDTPNNVSNFARARGKTESTEVTLAGSIAAEEGSILYPDPSNPGQYTIADATAGGNFVVIRQTIASTDDDFATAKRVLCDMPRDNNVEFHFTVGAGTFTSADEGKYADLNDEKSVAVDTSTKKQVFITKFVSATRGKCILAGNLGSGEALPVTS